MTVVATVEVPAEDLLLGSVFSSNPRIRIEMEPAVPLGSSPVHYMWVTGSTDEALGRAFQGATEVASFDVVETGSERTLVGVTWDENTGEFFDRVTEAGGVVLEATGTADSWTIHLRFDEHDQLGAFFRECVQRRITLDIRRVDDLAPPDNGGPIGELTDTQRETIRLAFEEGYFAVPREITLQELAAELDISDTAVSQRLRRGITTLLSSGVGNLNAATESPARPEADNREVTSPFE